MGAVSRDTVGGGYSADLEWLEAWAVSQSCRNQRFKQFGDLVVDGMWDLRSESVLRAVNAQMGRRPTAVVAGTLLRWLRLTNRLSVGELVRRCRSVEPAPPEPTPVEPVEPQAAGAVPSQMTIMAIDVTGKYARHVRLFVAAAPIFMKLVCVYWRCNIEVVAGSVADFDPDKHVALLFADGNGGVNGSAGWHWHGPVQSIFRELGIGVSDDDNDPIGWVDMTGSRWQRTAFHELVEIVVNPFVNLLARNFGDPSFYWMLETADAVQDDSFRVRVVGGEFDGELVETTDFVGPNWAGNDGEHASPGRASDIVGIEHLEKDFVLGAYDVMGLLSAPWQVRGYQILVSQTDPNVRRFRFGAGVSESDVPAHAARRVSQGRGGSSGKVQ